MVTAEEIIALLGLQPHLEGGFFAETYRAEETVAREALPERYPGPRSHGTAIYYLLTPGTCSAMHRIRSDEIFHFHLGDPVEMLHLWPDGSGQVVACGSDIRAGQQLQVVVPRGVWQGARLHPGGRFALLGTTVAPGFEYEDFEAGRREDLVRTYPAFREMITALTPADQART